ncbi:hypothetical protein ABTX81_12595 [Kitasatospora sp. NPDC097605]|uniref:hypothetical protein n=1 Tax=Kitasatospora sp. NPDC097605 TaxID=3157226 RepID=UPI003323B77D
MGKTSRRAKAGVAVAIAAGSLLPLMVSGTANAATSGGCRGYTAPGAYPSGVQLNPCNIVLNGSKAFGYVNSPQTDIRIYLQVGWKPASQGGEPTNFSAAYDVGVVGPGNGYYRGDLYWGGVPGYCYYTRMWYANGSYVSGWAESPATCF